MSRLNFFTILLIGFVDYLGIALVYPVFAALLFDQTVPLVPIGSSSFFRGAILGILIGLTPLTQFFSSPILGSISDLKGRRQTLGYGIGLGCLGYFLAVVGICIHSLSLLFIYRILIGISEGTVGVAQAMIADISTDQNKARRFALFNASLGTGFSIGPFLGGKLADPAVASWCGYAVPFILASVLSLGNLILVLFKFPETHRIKENKPFSLKQSITNIGKVVVWKQLRWLFFATFTFSFGWSFFNEFVPILLRERFNFALGEVGNYYAYGGIWYALSAAIASALLKYFYPENVVTKALIGCAICMLLFIIIPHSSYIWWILPPFMSCLAMTFPTTTALISNYANRENQGEVLGVYQSVIALAMGVSPLIVGFAVGNYPSLTSWGGAAAMLTAGWAFWMGKRRLSLSSNALLSS